MLELKKSDWTTRRLLLFFMLFNFKLMVLTIKEKTILKGKLKQKEREKI